MIGDDAIEHCDVCEKKESIIDILFYDPCTNRYMCHECFTNNYYEMLLEDFSTLIDITDSKSRLEEKQFIKYEIKVIKQGLTFFKKSYKKAMKLHIKKGWKNVRCELKNRRT